MLNQLSKILNDITNDNTSFNEFFPKYVKAHIDRGSELLLDMYNHAGNMDKYILQVLGVGDTV